MIPDSIKEKIDGENYTFMDKVLTGGFGYGKFCIPDELPHIILAIVFPPFSILWNRHLGHYTVWETIKKFLYCFILTMMFYFPGLIYAVNEISCKAKVRKTEQQHNEALGKA